MPARTSTLLQVEHSWRLRESERPLRAEAFSEDHLALHARALAASIVCIKRGHEDHRFLLRFAENAKFLRSSIEIIASAARDGLVLRPDSEWLLDNFYIVDEQLREIHDDLPRRYYRELPKTVSGEPRVYSLAAELVAHTDSVLDEESIVRFVSEFQTVTRLSMGEIWAVPIMLRLVLTENLRRIAAQILSAHASELKAKLVIEEWNEGTAFPIDLSQIHECGSLIFHVIDKLQQQGASSLERFRELERRLAIHELTVQQSVHLEHQRQASSQVSIGNVITSMRLISAVDWVAFFERTSLVEQILRQDPTGVYGRLDFESRDRYRHVVEDLADGCSQSESDVAEVVVDLARTASSPSERTRHIGFWLTEAGIRQLEHAIGFLPTFLSRPSRWLQQRPNLTYLGGVGVTTFIATLVSGMVLSRAGVPFQWLLLASALTILPASDLAVGLVNTLITTWLRPRLLPKFDFSSGIPEEHQTIVVIPSILTSITEADTLLQRLEMHFLANPDPILSFALLTDFAHASQADQPLDAELLQHTRSGIQSLNAKHSANDSGPFFLFHRQRRWNERDHIWMGWERKRGKLMEFNRLLRGDTNTSYVVDPATRQRLFGSDEQRKFRYVITLDSDTTLPHGAAQRLVATIAHPLNTPVYNTTTRWVESGYVLLQPRVTVNLSSAQNSRFAKTFANNPGIDPYSSCASDVYQDLYGEGSFTGKGIYDIDTFEQALEGAFPENQILSHDLIEGCHTRVGLVSDIELFDNYPPRYEADAKRQHRWVRGDWQISPWLLPVVPSASGWRANRLSLLSRWKIFDNLRRSLVAPALMIFLMAGWLAVPRVAWWFTTAGLLVQVFPIIAQLGLALRGWPRNVAISDHLRVLWTDLKRSALQTLLMTAFLPHKAWSMIDAVARTATRMLITRQKLLEWQTASEVEQRLAAGSGPVLNQWAVVSLFAVVLACFLQGPALVAALPFLLTWLASPGLAYWLSLPPRAQQRRPLEVAERQRLRRDARRIWAFFEAYVGPRGNWLPPDNVQEYPEEKIAYRISPTNEGLFLISGLVARDFGYLSLQSLTELWERNLTQWHQFDRLQGHFYNWYDTATLQPLFPRYVSTVDSGNLVACFLTLQQGIQELRTAPVIGAFLSEGLTDTIEMIIQTGQRMQLADDRRAQDPWEQFVDSMNRLRLTADKMPDSPLEWFAATKRWSESRADVATRMEPLAMSLHGSNRELLVQARALLDWLELVPRELTTLCPWLPLIQGAILEESSGPDLKIARSQWTSTSPSLDEPWQPLRAMLDAARTLTEIKQLPARVEPHLERLRRSLVADTSRGNSGVPDADDGVAAWFEELTSAINRGSAAAVLLDQRLESLSNQSEELMQATDFQLLYNEQRKLFSIGYNIEEGRLDSSHYDMLCSEARLASFMAIAKGDIEAKHWFRLGRQMTHTAGQLSLLSWGGTMFEYLMPQLFQKTCEESLLMHSCRAAVARQQEYGSQRGVPWGISECGFAALAANSDYHYRSFGVPGLGLKRGLSKDLVISPYSTMLAVEFDPRAALSNLVEIESEGGLGPWGFYEALDYTAERVPAGKRSIIVRSYMAHHQGMSLLSLGNLLLAGDTRRRFHDHAIVRATELLLQERVPSVMPKLEPHADERTMVPAAQNDDEMVSRRIVGVVTAAPRIQLLSNGQYSVMLTSTGGGYSQCNALGVTRWRSDATRDHWGQFLYLSDPQTGQVWSATYQPTCTIPTRYEAIYSIDKAEFFRRDGDLETHLEVVVSPENNSELRQLKIMNNSDAPREIEVTSYAEVSLVDPAADLAHSSFQKLFIETEYVPEKSALLARRRPRDSQQPVVWAMHAVSAAADVMSTVQFETSRQQFVGRGRTTQRPLALEPGRKLTGTTGAVLDPVFALRCRVTVPPFGSVSLAFTTAMAASRDEAVALADQYHDPRGVQRAFELAWAYCQVELRHLHLSPAQMHLYQRLASAMIYPDRARRPVGERLKENRQSQRGLWRYGISGDRPILAIYVTKPEHVDLVREALGAHLYWRGRGLRSDLAIVNDFPASYFDAMHEHLIELLQNLQIRLDDKPAEVFLLRGTQIPVEDKILLDSVASIVLHGDRGPLSRQLEVGTPGNQPRATASPRAFPAKSIATQHVLTPATSDNGDDSRADAREPHFGTRAPEELEFWNGFGGFSPGGREYQIRLSEGRTTPMPWSNVIANPTFGCLLTESGGGYTWSGNSRENKLTTWANDPVSDPPAEALYIYDRDSGELISPMAAVARDEGDYWTHHGQGYSRFIHHSHQLAQEVFISIAADEPVKFVVLTLRNERRQQRRLSVTCFAEWVLGVTRDQTQMHIATSIDDVHGALLATNTYHPDFPDQVAFLQVLGAERSVCGDRTEFLGRNGNFNQPAALGRNPLSDRTGAGFDPCGAVQTCIQLAAGEEIEVLFLLGAGDNLSDARHLLDRFSNPQQIRQSIDATIARWNETLEAVEIETPDRGFDLLVNRWLLYQTLSCRVWGRSAYYQSGGAYGFRDQLQDVMALVYSRPDLARSHIVTAASRQFEAGDVQHWWHPPEGRGTRTRFSDDLLWLPFVVCQYLAVTADESVLDEQASFLESPPLEDYEQERYELPSVSSVQASIYEHCRRTITHGFRVGAHGIPLMGCGDWNDGMNKVGELGRGESVWVGWFLLVILDRFLPLMDRRGDTQMAADFRHRAAALRQALEENAWDGEWYRRAYFDDGTPLGSAQNDECQIDSIAQTWAVIAGGDLVRSRIAVESVMKRLVQWQDGLVLLFAPPFNQSRLDPGYIKGYVPGIRENGGQYTHPAAWLIQALTILNDGDRAMQIFDLINPIHHASNLDAALRYQVEPYVIAADVYGVKPHIGRGGWTWYTGSAAWLYRAAIEFVLGFQLEGNSVRFVPRIPASWNGFVFRHRRGSGTWTFRIVRSLPPACEPQSNTRATGEWIPLTDESRSTEVIVVVQPDSGTSCLDDRSIANLTPPSFASANGSHSSRNASSPGTVVEEIGHLPPLTP